MTVPPLTFRLIKGAALTAAEYDENERIIRDFCDGLARLFEIVFNADGTLKNNTIGTASLQDRAVTQRKLDWLANFFCVASGVDNYIATISPTTGFTVASYGDGIITGMIVPVLFTNANTGASDFAINGAAAKPIKKTVGGVLVVLQAGDIAAGSAHLLLFDGANFQIISAIPSTVLNTPPKGIPNFLTPVEIQPATAIAVAWTTYNTLVADGVPSTASAVILEAVWDLSGPDPGPASFIKIRKESGADEYVLSCGNSGGSDDTVGGSNQGIFPIKETAGVLSIDYEITTGFNNNAVIRLIGFIS